VSDFLLSPKIGSFVPSRSRPHRHSYPNEISS
jgi:hypothetical protein